MKKIIFIFSLVIIFNTFHTSILAQAVIQWQKYPDYSGVINCMLDLDTAILAGAHEGLSCINKLTLQPTYYNSNNSGLLSGYITALEKDTLGSIWIGTHCGLTQWHGNNWTQYTPQNSILTCGVTAIRYVQASNSLLLGCENGNVIRIDTSGWNLITGVNGTYVQGKIRDIDEDSSGNIWVASDYLGVHRFNGTDWQPFNPNSGVIWEEVPSIAIDDAGIVWVLTTFGKVASYNGTSWVSHPYIPGVNWARYISAEENQTIWISTTNGIYTYNGVTYTPHPINPFLNYPELSCHVKDKQQEIWAGTYYYGVERGLNLTVTYFPLAPELGVSCVQDVAYDPVQGKAWFATDDLQHKTSFAGSFDGTNWVNINTFNSPITTAHSARIAVDSNSNLYLGTYNEGLWVRQGNNWTQYNISNSNLASDSVTALAIDFNNQLLLGFFDGSVQVFNNNNFTTLIPGGNIKQNVHHIEPENASVFWVATDSLGLFRCNYNNYIVFDTSNSQIPSNHIDDIRLGNSQQYWVATDKGLAMYNSVTWTVYTTANSGLPYNHIKCITFAPDSSIWIATTASDLAVFKNNNWSIYNTCNSPILPCRLISDIITGTDGKIYIGNNDGLNIVTYDIINKVQDKHLDLAGLKAFPNPASDIIQFELSNKVTHLPSLLEIYNPLGQKVYHTDVSPNQQSIDYDVSQLDTGIYFAILKTGKTILGRVKFVVD